MTMNLIFFIWLFLLLFGVPIYVSLGISSLLYVLTQNFQLLVIPQRIAMAANSFPLLAAPFFILMGNLMNQAGVTKRIFNFANTLVGWITGGLGQANVVASMIFAGMSGTAVADAGGLGTIEIEAMRQAGYDDEFSCAITAASATIGPIIPPSLPMVIYGVLADTSIGGLFIGGIIPGVLMGLSLMFVVYIIAKNKNYPKRPVPTWKEVWKSFIDAFWAILTPIILLAGIASGIFTPTEAAIIAAFYALILGLFIYRELKIKDIPNIILKTVETNGVVLALVMTAVLFGWNLSVAQIPQTIGQFLTGISQNPLIMLLIINIFLLFVGLFMEAIAAMLILVPILLPVLVALNINPIQAGVIIVLNLMIGTITPPVGIVLYVTANVAKISFERVTKAVFPFILPLLIVLLLITLIPSLTTFLPRIILGIQ
jgi:tripartite ATP-independent transporter DctM subunit